MRKIISLICLLLPLAANADELQLQENAPDRYVVVKGDTLWDISARFFKDPWKWPEIWGYNKDTIKDPHWIYPGDTVYLDRAHMVLSVNEPPPAMASGVPATETEQTSSVSDAVKMSPRARVVPGTSEAIPSVSLKDIGPFLSRPLVIEEDEMENSPILAGTYEQRQLLGYNDVAYAENMPSDKGKSWQIYRPDRKFIDPETREMLGYEVIYLGDAMVEKFGDVTSLKITRSVLEIHKGDRFSQSVSGFSANYLPHAPRSEINARVISVYGGVVQAGQNAVITLNKGRRDGLENGHVLSLYQTGEVLDRPGLFTGDLVLPDVKYGTVFVFRVFEKVSYALVMQTRLPVQLQDSARNPE